MAELERIKSLFTYIYGDKADTGMPELTALLTRYQKNSSPGPTTLPDERDVFLITYGDSLTPPSGPALAALGRLAANWLSGMISYIHILPFCPYSSDDGFSVIDYRKVNPVLGTWDDLTAAVQGFKPAFDLVLNHVSAESPWFKRRLQNDPAYTDWFIEPDAAYDISQVVRPRTHPLLSIFNADDGTSHNIWTTFSADQVDLNFANPAVLLEMLDVFLFYISRGARIIRLDAIAYLWKESGNSCLHHPKTHAVVKLFRAVADYLHLDVLILTETNVPHEDNISYFGQSDEAHMVYNFALPPLVLHSFTSGNAKALTAWAEQLKQGGVFLNFLASHDGIGVTPVRGLISNTEFENLLEKIQQRGGLISWKTVSGGQIPYELNISWYSAIAAPELGIQLRLSALWASYMIAAVLDGMPAVYIHSLFATENWLEGVEQRGYNRAINRKQLSETELSAALADKNSVPARALHGFRRLFSARAAEPAFKPGTSVQILRLHESVFSLVRQGSLFCAINVSAISVSFELPEPWSSVASGYNPINGDIIIIHNKHIELAAYGIVWIKHTE